MKVMRTYETETSTYEVGDVIAFELEGGEKVEAMAMRQEADGMLFLFVDCLKDEERMNEEDSNRGGFDASDLRMKLNREIVERFPTEIREQMVAFANGDMLRLPTEKEIFGINEYGEDEGDVEQFAPMKLRRNRIAFQGLNGNWEWYWLANKHKRSASYFARVHYLGYADYANASDASGVRPAFKIKNL